MFAAINAWTFPADFDVSARISAAADVGFGGIELTLDADGPLTAQASKGDLTEFAGLAGDRDIRIVGLATGLFWAFNYGSRSPSERQRAFDLTRRMLDMAATLHAGAVLVVPAVVGKASDPRGSVRYADALVRTFEALLDLRPHAEAHQVAIALENVWNRFLLSPVELADLIDRVNSPYMGVYFDVGNCLALGYPEDWIHTLGKRIVRIHLKDYDLSRPGRDGFCTLGEGSVDWAGVMSQLRQIDYDGPLTYEGPGEPVDVLRRVQSVMGAGERRSE
jgi:hexulose-6-phosphate isomerase